MKVTGIPKRLFKDTSGQVLLFAAILVLAIITFMLVVPNATRVTTQKVRTQTAADVGSFTGSIWLSRSLNLNANMNIGIRSVHMWMVVLTMGEAPAQALYNNTRDSPVHASCEELALALHGEVLHRPRSLLLPDSRIRTARLVPITALE